MSDVAKLERKGVRCAECGAREAVCVPGDVIYPHRRDLFGKSFWLCPCGAYVGCHPGTVNALGYCAGPETRAARSRAHAAFDPIWREGTMRRSEAYKALADEMKIDAKHCHISWMGKDEADHATRAAAVLKSRIAEPCSPTPITGDRHD